MNRNRVLTRQTATAVGLLLAGMSVMGGAQATGCEPTFDPMLGMTLIMGHPCAQPHPGPSTQVFHADGSVEVTTPEGQHPPQDPFAEPPGSNFLLNVYENMQDLSGREMPNTLPSTPTNPYNLHDGPVLTRSIDPTNPEDDLDMIIDHIEKKAAKSRGSINQNLVKLGIDILEGNKLKGKFKKRAYSGFPMLHYNGPNKVKKVEPIYDDEGNVVGGNVVANMIYFNQHIESDLAFVDPSAVQEVPWTITYHVNILNRGMEDFSPMVMNFNRLLVPDMDNPGEMVDMRGPFHASMDQSYFPMLDEGTRYSVKIKENLGKYYNLTYIWGWRIHPPRVQVIENALKMAPPQNPIPLPDHERIVFCPQDDAVPGVEDCNPQANRDAKLFAIGKIGDLSPAKRMWNIFKSLENCKGKDCRGNKKPRGEELAAIASDLREAFLDWQDRTRLPTGVEADPDATVTLLYVNNTIYGSRQGLTGEGSELGPASYKGIANGSAHDWTIRPYDYHVTLLNGDHFPHGYMNVDFGGSRGWENHFQYTDPTTAEGAHPVIPPGHPGEDAPFSNPENTVAGHENIYPINRGGIEEFLQPTARNLDDPVNGEPQLGSGCFFTFGRNHAWPNAGGPWGAFGVPPVQEDGEPSMRKVTIHYNFEPSRRLRIYQFDPLHHDVAVYSLH